MVYARKSYRRPYRRSYRKYVRKTRKRYSKKRFIKYSTKQRTQVKAPVNSRETFVKLPWQQTTSEILAANTSKSYAFLGNSLNPFGSYNNSPPPAGSVWASGVSEYANFYERYRVLGASIKIRMVTNGTAGVFRCVLIPIMAGGPESAGSLFVNDRITELDALTYDQLSVQPYAQSRSLGISTGSNAVCNFKMFRKSKSMLACKDYLDLSDVQAELPQPDGSGGSIINNAIYTWFYYLRIFNVTSSTMALDVSTKMKFYCQLSGRNNWVPQSVPS